MGYKAGVRTIPIRFAEDHQYHGAEARVRSMSFGEYMAATGFDGGEGEDDAASLARFERHLASWNLVDDDEQPIPVTPEGIRSADQGLIRSLQSAWLQAVIRVHDADPLPQSLPSGEPSLVESVPMEALSPPLAS